MIDIKLYRLYTTGYNEATNDLTVYTKTLENEETARLEFLIASFNFAVEKGQYYAILQFNAFCYALFSLTGFSFDLKFEKDH